MSENISEETPEILENNTEKPAETEITAAPDPEGDVVVPVIQETDAVVIEKPEQEPAPTPIITFEKDEKGNIAVMEVVHSENGTVKTKITDSSDEHAFTETVREQLTDSSNEPELVHAEEEEVAVSQNVDWGMVIFIMLIIGAAIAGITVWLRKK